MLPGVGSIRYSNWTKVFIGFVCFVAFIGFILFTYTLVFPFPETFTACDAGTTPTYLGDFLIGGKCYNIFHFVFGTDVDKAWVTSASIIQYLIFPFVAVLMVIYGIFSEIRFFRQTWINFILGLIVALIVSSQGFLVRMMRAFLLMGGGMGIMFFGVVFIIGIILWFVGRMASFGVSGGSLSKLAHTNVKIENIKTMIERAEGFAGGLNPATQGVRAAEIIKLAGEARQKLYDGHVDDAFNKAREALDKCQIPT